MNRTLNDDVKLWTVLFGKTVCGTCLTSVVLNERNGRSAHHFPQSSERTKKTLNVF